MIGLPAGRWSGPVASLYGHHLVYVEERKEAELQPLDAVRRTVEQQVLAQLADEWLQLRLAGAARRVRDRGAGRDDLMDAQKAGFGPRW